MTDRAGKTTLLSVTVAISGGSWSYSGAALPAGSTTATFTQWDGAGNSASASANFQA